MKIGYHLKPIKKGKFGKISKIEEELKELKDAKKQNNKIMMLCELSDLLGAIEAVGKSLGVKSKDLRAMSKATKRAFKNGHRT